MTCGPLVPKPSRKRPPETDCMPMAVMASSAGVRVPPCRMPVPSLMVLVWAARKASGVTPSWPQASADQTEWTPRRSASCT